MSAYYLTSLTDLKCPFCQVKLFRGDSYHHYDDKAEESRITIVCENTKCKPLTSIAAFRQIIQLHRKMVIKEQYVLKNYYVEVNNFQSIIIPINDNPHLFFPKTDNAIKVPRSIWLNQSDTSQTLNTLNIIMTFS